MIKRHVFFYPVFFILTIPLILTFWIFINFVDNDKNFRMGRFLIGFIIPLFFSIFGFKKEYINLSGAISGFICAFILTLSNYCFLACLIVFFVLGSRATKFKSKIKTKLELDYKKSSKRSWIQVVSNIGVPVYLSLIYLIETGQEGELPIDFELRFNTSCLIIAILSSFACVCGDTFSSEIGLVLSKKDPFLITTFRKVPRGTNGGISIIGLFVSAIGGFVIGICYYLTFYLLVDLEEVLVKYPQWPVILIATLSGLYGSIVDSYIGAIFQYSGLNKKTGQIVDKPGEFIEHISGFYLLNNHIVNFISAVLSSVSATVFAVYFYENFI